jgi:hypothetical protein
LSIAADNFISGNTNLLLILHDNSMHRSPRLGSELHVRDYSGSNLNPRKDHPHAAPLFYSLFYHLIIQC